MTSKIAFWVSGQNNDFCLSQGEYKAAAVFMPQCIVIFDQFSLKKNKNTHYLACLPVADEFVKIRIRQVQHHEHVCQMIKVVVVL